MSISNLLKTVFITAAVSGALQAAAQQQMPPSTPEERAQKQMQWMEKNLALTNEQDKRVYDILLRSAQEVDKARNSTNGREKKMEVQDVKKDKDAELKSVLTGEQYQRYQAHAEQMKEKMMERRAGRQMGN